MSIEQLIHELKNGEESAFKELVLTFSKSLMTVSKVYTNSLEDAEDVLQDAFIIIFEKISTFTGIEKKMFFGWMKRITINLALSKNKKKYKIMEQSLDALELDQAIDAQILSDLSEQEIMKMIFELPAGYRQVFALFAIEGYSHKEIAEKLNIASSTSRSQFVRAKRILQKQVNQHFKIAVS